MSMILKEWQRVTLRKCLGERTCPMNAAELSSSVKRLRNLRLPNSQLWQLQRAVMEEYAASFSTTVQAQDGGPAEESSRRTSPGPS